MPLRIKVNFATKLITGGVFAKAIVMGVLVSLLAVTSFEKSIILVLVSATATGIFGILIVLIQVHSERGIHERINQLEYKTTEVVDQAKTEVSETVVIKADEIKETVNPSEGWDGTERRDK